MGFHAGSRIPFLLKSLLCLVTLPVLIYANTFANSFLFDDTHLILQNLGIKHLDDLPTALVYDTPSRPVMMLSFALNYHLGGLQVFGYHLANLAFHMLTCLLLFVIILKTPCSSHRVGRRSFALLASLLFAVHPVFTEAVTYISSRSALLAAFFYLFSLYGFLRFHGSANPAGRRSFYIFALLSYFISLWAKEIAITFPAILALYDFFFLFGEGREGFTVGVGSRAARFFKERINYHLAFLAVSVLFFVMRYFYLGEILEKESSFVQAHGRLVYFLTQCRVIPCYYLGKLLSPFNLNIDPDYPLAEPASGLFSLVPVFSFALLVIPAFYLLKRNIAATFALSFFLIALTPTSSLIPILDVAAEHRLYLPAGGFMLLPALCLLSLFLAGRGKIRPVFRVVGIFVLPLLFLSTDAIHRNGVYRTPETLWRDAISKSPRKARPWFGLGYYYDRTGKPERALVFYRKALSIEPYYPSLHMTIGALYNRMGFPGRALGHAKAAVDLEPGGALYHNLLGDVYQKLGRFAESAKEFRKTVRLKPLYAPAYFNLGNWYAQRKEYEKAVELYEKALKIDPDLKPAKENLAAARALKNTRD